MSDKALSLAAYAFYGTGSICFLVGTAISVWGVVRK